MTKVEIFQLVYFVGILVAFIVILSNQKVREDNDLMDAVAVAIVAGCIWPITLFCWVVFKSILGSNIQLPDARGEWGKERKDGSGESLRPPEDWPRK